MFFSYLGSMPRSIRSVTPGNLTVMLLTPFHHHLSHYRLTDFPPSQGPVGPRMDLIPSYLQFHFLHLLRGHNLLPPLPSPTVTRPSHLLTEHHTLNMYPLPQLANQSPFRVQDVPKLHMEKNGTEDPQPRKSTVSTSLKKREDNRRNPVVWAPPKQGMRHKWIPAQRSPGKSLWPPLQPQVGHTIHSSREGGRTKSGKFARGPKRMEQKAV